jgi:hypothetical protein
MATTPALVVETPRARVRSPSRRLVLPLVIVAWAALVAGGTVALARYKAQPGPQAAGPASWPAESIAPRLEGLHTLVMLAHPRCPCTMASLTELARLLSRLDGRVRSSVVFIRPSGAEDEWRATELWRRAEDIPGLTIVDDPGGVEARRFGAYTSGHVFLYAPDGALRFSGGITSARGHEGDSPGQARIIALVSTFGLGDEATSAEAPVFGCALEDPSPTGEPR